MGKVKEDKLSWAVGSPETVNSTPTPVVSGSKLTIIDDVYLHADSASNSRSSAEILGAAKVGDSIEVLEVDYSHAKGVGWFVWAKILRKGLRKQSD